MLMSMRITWAAARRQPRPLAVGRFPHNDVFFHLQNPFQALPEQGMIITMSTLMAHP